MNYEDVQKVSNAAKAKSNLVNTNFFKYFIRAVMAGFFIDMAMIYSDVPCVAAGTFTTNIVKAAPV